MKNSSYATTLDVTTLAASGTAKLVSPCKRAPKALVLCAGLFLLLPLQAVAGGKRNVDIPFNANTRDLHIRMGGNITGAKMTPAPDQETTSHQWHAAWNVAPGAGNKTVSLEYTGDKGALTYVLTTTGNVNEQINWATGTNVAGLGARFDPGGASFAVWGDNEFSQNNAQVGTITATLVADLNRFYADDWATATGQSFTITGGTVNAGGEHNFASNLNMQGASWVLLKANIDGDEVAFASAPVPEPATVAALVIGIAAMLRRRCAK